MSNSSSSVFIASTEIGDADPVPRQLVAAQQTDFGRRRESHYGSNEWVKPSEKPGGEAKNAL